MSSRKNSLFWCISYCNLYFRGIIHPVQNPGTKPGPLIHCHTAEGHTKAVLSVRATEDLLFSSSKGNVSVVLWICYHVNFQNQHVEIRSLEQNDMICSTEALRYHRPCLRECMNETVPFNFFET